MRAETVEAIRSAIKARTYVVAESCYGVKAIRRSLKYRGKYLIEFNPQQCEGLTSALVILEGGPYLSDAMIDFQIQASQQSGIRFMNLYTKKTEWKLYPHWGRGQRRHQRRRSRL